MRSSFFRDRRTAPSPPPCAQAFDDAEDDDPSLNLTHLRTGSTLTFFLTAFLSTSFNLLGFTITYLFHTSHAAKYGSRAGLGLTLIRFAIFERMQSLELRHDPHHPPLRYEHRYQPWNAGALKDAVFAFAAFPAFANNSSRSRLAMTSPPLSDFIFQGEMSVRDWISLVCVVLGVFTLAHSLFSFYLSRRRESLLYQRYAATMITVDPTVFAMSSLPPAPPPYHHLHLTAGPQCSPILSTASLLLEDKTLLPPVLTASTSPAHPAGEAGEPERAS